MYRVILVVLLQVACTYACRPPPCHWKDAKPIENYFEQVARKVINADRKAETFCYKQCSPNVVEMHEVQEYKLKIPGAAGPSYEIKVRDRVVQVVSDNCQNSVTDLWILPTYVDGYRGHYYFDNNDLVVAFLYKYDPGVGGGICEEVNRNPITLHMCNTCSVP